MIPTISKSKELFNMSNTRAIFRKSIEVVEESCRIIYIIVGDLNLPCLARESP